MSNKKSINFAIPGQQQNDIICDEENSNIDFSKMTKKQIKQFDAQYGSYRRLLGDKPITGIWLINHYSQANAAAYKRQKEQAKLIKNQEQRVNPERQKEKSDYAQDCQSISYENANRREVQQEQNQQLQLSERNNNSVYTDEPVDYFGNTVFIDRNKPIIERKRASLFCVGFDQKVEIKNVPFVIGRIKQGVDLCIPDNNTISGRHAEIIFDAGEYHIVDLHSLNHVYIDDVQIPSEKPVRLRSGNIIVLGNEKFVFEEIY